MTRNILKFGVFLSIVTACEKIENETFQPLLAETSDKVIVSNGQGWEWMASFQNIEMNIDDANTSSYSLNLRQTIHLAKDGAIIKEAGFKVVSPQNNGITLVPATVSHSGNDLIAETVLQCSYGGHYSITPRIAIDQYEFYGEEQTFSRSIEEMKPKAENMATDVEMATNAHTITAVVETDGMVDGVDFTFAGITRPATKNGNRFTADYDLNELAVKDDRQTDYNGITFTATNMFGQATGNIRYAVRVLNIAEEVSKQCASDGMYDDYATIAGTKWAKGNLICRNGVWGFDSDPLGHEPTLQDDSFQQYFSYGSTKADKDKYMSYEELDNMPEYIGGDSRYDVAAANMPGWRLPKANEAWQLLDASSQQMCNNGMVVCPVGKSRKQFVSNTSVTLVKVPTDGLFFPMGGYDSGWGATSTGTGAYLMDAKQYHASYCLLFPLSDDYLVASVYFSFGPDRYHETTFNLAWKYYVRPVYNK